MKDLDNYEAEWFYYLDVYRSSNTDTWALMFESVVTMNTMKARYSQIFHHFILGS